MMEIPVVVRQSTLLAVSEHSTTYSLNNAVMLNKSEALIILDEEVLAELLRHAQPGDKRIDDIIIRIAM